MILQWFGTQPYDHGMAFRGLNCRFLESNNVHKLTNIVEEKFMCLEISNSIFIPNPQIKTIQIPNKITLFKVPNLLLDQ